MQNPVALLWRSFPTTVSRAITKKSFKYKENDWNFHIVLEKNACRAQMYQKKKKKIGRRFLESKIKHFREFMKASKK